MDLLEGRRLRAKLRLAALLREWMIRGGAEAVSADELMSIIEELISIGIAEIRSGEGTS